MENNKKISNGVKKLGIYLLYGGTMILAVTLVYISLASDKKPKLTESNPRTLEKDREVKIENQKPAEKIQVYLFHSTNRCYSCVTAGELARKTMEQNFPKEIESGRIDFREINVDLPQNKELASKFQAAGTSFFLNPIIDGQDNIKEDTQIWRLISSEQAFIDYLSGKINSLL